MTDEKKSLYITVFFGIIESIFSIITFMKFSTLLLVINVCISIILVGLIIKLYFYHKRAIDSYEYIKFLFFGSEYNVFNLFPKLMLYMDYLNMKNPVDVNTIEFECVDDISNGNTSVQWIIKNICNNTNKYIKSYYIYSMNEYGSMDHVDIEVKEGVLSLPIDTNNIRKRNSIQQTPFTFREPVMPKGTVPEIKICMQMHDGFMQKKERVVCLYPRNYGVKVEHISIAYKIKGTRDVSVKLHEIGKGENGYFDEPIKSCVPIEENGEQIYYFCLNKDEINVNNLYYILISEK